MRGTDPHETADVSIRSALEAWKLAAVGGLAVLALAACGDSGEPASGDAPVRESSPSPTAEPEPTPEQTQPVGRYRGTWKFVAVEPAAASLDPAVRQPEPRTWTFSAGKCTDTTCRGTIKSSTGSTLKYTWDGRTLEIPAEIQSNSSGCVYDDGSTAPGTLTNKLRIEMSGSGKVTDGPPKSLDILQTNSVVSFTDDEANNCRFNRPVPDHWTKRMKLTSVG